MSRPLERRLERLERGASLGLPWTKPLVDWSDEQLLAVLGVGSEVTDLFLLGMSRPEALIFGVREQTVAEWMEANSAP